MENGIVVLKYGNRGGVTRGCRITDKRIKVDLCRDDVLVWDRDGAFLGGVYPADYPAPSLQAYRALDGAWKVIDASVSSLLPTIDGKLEDGT